MSDEQARFGGAAAGGLPESTPSLFPFPLDSANLGRIGASMGATRAAQLRAEGVGEDDIRRLAMEFIVARGRLFLAGGMAMEYAAENFAMMARRAVDDELAGPDPGPLDEAARRLPGWAEADGVWVELADGRRWSFPAVEGTPLDALPEGVQADVVALMDGPGYVELTRLMAEVGRKLLLARYRLADAEARRLIPMSAGDPEDVGAIAAMIPVPDLAEVRPGLPLEDYPRIAEPMSTALARIFGGLTSLVSPIVARVRASR